jgi:DNA (cytosine-5)-methyltransferase 1
MARILSELQPSWVVIENVDGLLSSHAGADFGIVLRELENVGYVGAWRVLDSRWFGVPQRRNRVFIVGHRGTDTGRARSVLFESARRSWNSPPREETEPHVAATLRGRAHGVGVRPPGRGGEDDVNLVPLSLAGPLGGGNDGIGWRSEDDPNLVVYDTTQITSATNRSNPQPGRPCHPLAATAHAPLLSHALSASKTRTGRLDPNGETFIASALTESMGHRGYGSPRGDANDNLITGTLGTSNGARQHLEQHYEVVGALGGNKERGGWRCGPDEVAANQAIESQGVRRLTPLECERLQGFPDGYTCLCGVTPYSTRACRCKDGPRYRALGNAVTVNVIEWIGRRLLRSDAQQEEVA